MATKNELDDLLGSESEGEQNYKSVKETPVKSAPSKRPSVDDLLGLSDDDDDSQNVFKEDEDSLSERDDNKKSEQYLDKILGKIKVEPGKVKTKTTSEIDITSSYKIPSSVESIFLRTPNFIKIQPQKYDPYDDEIYAKEKQMFAGATSVIRHRVNPITKELESNARFVKWDDGTYQLIVGDATFNVKIVPTDNW